MFVPAHILGKEFLEANFLIPADEGVRSELRRKLETYSHVDIVFMPGNEKARAVLLAQIAAIDAYNATLAKIGKRK